MNYTKWICPKCATPNTDDKDETLLPMCENCANSFEWEDLTEQGSGIDIYKNLSCTGGENG